MSKRNSSSPLTSAVIFIIVLSALLGLAVKAAVAIAFVVALILACNIVGWF